MVGGGGGGDVDGDGGGGGGDYGGDARGRREERVGDLLRKAKVMAVLDPDSPALLHRPSNIQ